MHWNALRAGLIAIAGLSLGLDATPSFGQAPGKCPLSEAQSKQAVAAFAKIAGFVTSEPRCVNCHGGVNPYIDGTGLDPDDPAVPFSIVAHGGGVILKKEDYGRLIDSECMDCHDNMARKRDGSPSTWMTAAPVHAFVDKDPVTLCRQFKRASPSAAEFLAHLTDDNGGNNFAETAFRGDRGLAERYLDPENGSYVAPRSPAMTHRDFLALAQAWIQAMGGEFQGDEKCGCELTHEKWSGMIRYVLQEKGDAGNESGPGWSRAWSQRATTRITISLTDGVGTIRYDVDASAETTNQGKYGSSTSTTTKSGQGRFPVIADVGITDYGAYGAGSYLVTYTLDFDREAVRHNAGNPLIGTQRIETCTREGCTQADSELYAPAMLAGEPLTGKTENPNRIIGTVTLKKDGLGQSGKGVRIETMTVDLWRSPPTN